MARYEPPDYSDDPLVIAVAHAPDAAAVSALLFSTLGEPRDIFRLQAALRVAPALELGLVWGLLATDSHLEALAASPALTPTLRQEIRRHYTRRLDTLTTIGERSTYLHRLKTFAPGAEDPDASAQIDALWTRCTPKSATSRVNRTHAEHAATFLSSTVGVTPARLLHLVHHFWSNTRIVAMIVDHAATTAAVLDALFQTFETRRTDRAFVTDWSLRGARVRFLETVLHAPAFRQDPAFLPRWWALTLFSPTMDDRAQHELLNAMAAFPGLPDRVLALRGAVRLSALPFSDTARAEFLVRADIRPSIDHAFAQTLLSDPAAEIRQAGIFALAQPDPGVPPLVDLPSWTAPDVWAECQRVIDSAAAAVPRDASAGGTSRYSHLSRGDWAHNAALHNLRDRWVAERPTTDAALLAAVTAVPSVRDVLLPVLELARRLVQLRRTLVWHYPTILPLLDVPAPVPASPAPHRR